MENPKKEEITLKELAGYFSNQLMMQVQSIDGIEILCLTGLYSKDGYDIVQISNTDYYIGEENDFSIKAVLRPLPDLIKDENFQLHLELREALGIVICEDLLLALLDKTYHPFDLSKIEALEEFMNKHHFDWKFNLIQRGLAIDMNSIQNKS